MKLPDFKGQLPGLETSGLPMFNALMGKNMNNSVLLIKKRGRFGSWEFGTSMIARNDVFFHGKQVRWIFIVIND